MISQIDVSGEVLHWSTKKQHMSEVRGQLFDDNEGQYDFGQQLGSSCTDARLLQTGPDLKSRRLVNNELGQESQNRKFLAAAINSRADFEFDGW